MSKNRTKSQRRREEKIKEVTKMIESGNIPEAAVIGISKYCFLIIMYFNNMAAEHYQEVKSALGKANFRSNFFHKKVEILEKASKAYLDIERAAFEIDVDGLTDTYCNMDEIFEEDLARIYDVILNRISILDDSEENIKFYASVFQMSVLMTISEICREDIRERFGKISQGIRQASMICPNKAHKIVNDICDNISDLTESRLPESIKLSEDKELMDLLKAILTKAYSMEKIIDCDVSNTVVE